MSVHCVRIRSDALSHNRKVKRSVCTAANLSQSRTGYLKNSTFFNSLFIEGHSFVTSVSSEEFCIISKFVLDFALLDFSVKSLLPNKTSNIHFLFELGYNFIGNFWLYQLQLTLKVNQELNVRLFCCSFLLFFLSKNTVLVQTRWMMSNLSEFSVKWVQEKC